MQAAPPLEIFRTDLCFDAPSNTYKVQVSVTDPNQVRAVEPRLLDLATGDNTLVWQGRHAHRSQSLDARDGVNADVGANLLDFGGRPRHADGLRCGRIRRGCVDERQINAGRSRRRLRAYSSPEQITDAVVGSSRGAL
jgi:hypothetical protein